MADHEERKGQRTPLELAQAGFSPDAKRYDRGRPSYPVEAVQVLVAQVAQVDRAASTRLVVEVGAGTGKFTELLLRHLEPSSRVLCVEPVAAMRQTLAEQPWAVEAVRRGQLQIVDGTADKLPVADGAADAVFAAQAFHWFATAQVVCEFARVLKPRGVVGLIWNTRDTSHKWLEAVDPIIDSMYENEPRQSTKQWMHAFCDTPEQPSPFGPLASHSVQYAAEGSWPTFQDRVLSISAIARRSDEEKRVLLQRLRQAIEKELGPDFQDKVRAIPYVTETYWAVKKTQDSSAE